MIDRGGHLRLLSTTRQAVVGDNEEWVEETPIQDLPITPWQHHLEMVREAEDRFVEETTGAPEETS